MVKFLGVLEPKFFLENHNIKQAKNKIPGLSGMSAVAIKNLQDNYRGAIIYLFDAVIASKYWPKVLTRSKMIFVLKRCKDQTDPLNYRPLCLLEILAKILERMLSSCCSS